MFEHIYYEKESQPVSHSHLQQQMICNGFWSYLVTIPRQAFIHYTINKFNYEHSGYIILTNVCTYTYIGISYIFL